MKEDLVEEKGYEAKRLGARRLMGMKPERRSGAKSTSITGR